MEPGPPAEPPAGLDPLTGGLPCLIAGPGGVMVTPLCGAGSAPGPIAKRCGRPRAPKPPPAVSGSVHVSPLRTSPPPPLAVTVVDPGCAPAPRFRGEDFSRPDLPGPVAFFFFFMLDRLPAFALALSSSARSSSAIAPWAGFGLVAGSGALRAGPVRSRRFCACPALSSPSATPITTSGVSQHVLEFNTLMVPLQNSGRIVGCTGLMPDTRPSYAKSRLRFPAWRASASGAASGS